MIPSSSRNLVSLTRPALPRVGFVISACDKGFAPVLRCKRQSSHRCFIRFSRLGPPLARGPSRLRDTIALDAWQSGLMRLFRKQELPRGIRGFESSRVRLTLFCGPWYFDHPVSSHRRRPALPTTAQPFASDRLLPLTLLQQSPGLPRGFVVSGYAVCWSYELDSRHRQ